MLAPLLLWPTKQQNVATSSKHSAAWRGGHGGLDPLADDVELPEQAAADQRPTGAALDQGPERVRIDQRLPCAHERRAPALLREGRAVPMHARFTGRLAAKRMRLAADIRTSSIV